MIISIYIDVYVDILEYFPYLYLNYYIYLTCNNSECFFSNNRTANILLAFIEL